MTKRRILEIVPGFISWNLILFPIWGGYLLPEVAAYFILLFVVYSVYRSFTLTVATVVSHFRIKAAQRVDWMKEVEGFGDWKRVRHIVMILVANEPTEVPLRTVEALTRQTFPLKQLAVVLAASGNGKPINATATGFSLSVNDAIANENAKDYVYFAFKNDL